MLRISRLADYATVIMSKFVLEVDSGISAAEIAKATHLSLPTVRKILKQLLEAKLLVSERGVNGGYQLAKAADKIPLSEIIEAIDGPFALTECSLPSGSCQILKNCGTRENWQVINQVVKAALNQLDLLQISVSSKRK